MKVIVTGNMGYVGPSVIKMLRSSYPEARIIGFDTGYFAHCLTCTNGLPETSVDLQYFGDIRDFPYEILKDVDAVVHLAAVSNDPMGNVNEGVTLDINHKASVELAKKAKLHGVRSFVFSSSCSVYGFNEENERNENSEVNPLTPYAKSKIFSERDLANIASKDFKVTCLRFATACGMSERLRLDLVLNDFVASAISTGKIVILSDGMPWRPLININDMARGIDWAIKRDGDEYLIVNVGSNEWNYRIKDLAYATAKIIPNVEVTISKNAMPDKRSYKVSFNLYKKLAPLYQCQYDLEKTINELRDGLISIGFNDKNFRNSPFFIRLKTLEELKNRKILSGDFKWLSKDKDKISI